MRKMRDRRTLSLAEDEFMDCQAGDTPGKPGASTRIAPEAPKASVSEETPADATATAPPAAASAAGAAADAPSAISLARAPDAAASAAPGPSRAAKRQPRAPATHTPPDLPATASEVTDCAALSRVVTSLSNIIVKAVYDGKSVTASNKRLIALAAEEMKRAVATFERLPSEPLATRSAATVTAAQSAAGPASAGPPPPPPPPSSSEAADELRGQLSTCIREVRQLRGDLSAATLAMNSASASSSSYAQIARRPAPALTHAPADARRPRTAPVDAPQQPQPRSSKPAIVIATKTPVGTRQEAVEAFRKSISFREAKYAPSKVSPLSGNKLRVEFDSPQDCEDALRRLRDSSSSQVTAEPVKKLRPMCILKGISEDMSVEDLAGVVLRQNVELEKFGSDDIVFKFKRNNNRSTKLYNAVFVVSPQLFRAVVQMGRIRVDHQRVHTEEFSPFLQCFFCLQFGHVRRHCRSEQKRCSRCAGTTHAGADCPSREDAKVSAKCYNCTAHNDKFPNKLNALHNATSHSCPIVRSVRDRISRTIDYGI